MGNVTFITNQLNATQTIANSQTTTTMAQASNTNDTQYYPIIPRSSTHSTVTSTSTTTVITMRNESNDTIVTQMTSVSTIADITSFVSVVCLSVTLCSSARVRVYKHCFQICK